MILLSPSLGFISEIGSEKGHCADAPPPLLLFAPSPLIYTLLLYLSCLVPPPLSALLPLRGALLSPTISPLCSLALSLPSLALARNKFAMKMGKNDHHGPARETQGESDIIPPTLDPPPPFSPSQPSRLAPVGRLCHKSFVYSHFCERSAMLLTA